MNKLIVILTMLVLVLSSGIVFLIKENNENLASIARLNDNVSVLNTNNEALKFKVSEFRDYLKSKETTHKKEVDSILSTHKVRISQLKKYQKLTVSTIDLDTATVNFKDTIPIMDSLYVMPYERVSECVSVSGRVISKDKSTQLFIDSIRSENIIYQTISYKKTFWDWIFRRVGKEVVRVSSKCGSVENSEIEVIE